MNTIDLQVHSTASDGKHGPREVVRLAKENKIEAMALTDHDTVNGVAEAIEAGSEFGVRVISGIELSVEERDIHILGYGLDCYNSKLLEALGAFRQERMEGAKKMVENLKQAGFFLDFEDVLKEAVGGLIARPHLARAILNRPENKELLGGISTAHDFIEANLSNSSPNYVRRSHISACRAIELLNRAGGVAVWSHPSIHFLGDTDGLENFLKDLIEWGLEGVEVFNPSHTEDDAEFMQGIAVKYGLLRTAGSDFHAAEPAKRPDERGLRSAVAVGDYETFGFFTSDIVAQLDKAMKKKRAPLD